MDGSLHTGVSSSPTIDCDGSNAEQIAKYSLSANMYMFVGWAKYMTWKYPVEVRFTNEASFKAAGAVEAAASL